MAMSPRKRAQVSRGAQYAILAVVVVAIAFVADWPTLKDTFISPEITPELFPEILTIALKNTIYLHRVRLRVRPDPGADPGPDAALAGGSLPVDRDGLRRVLPRASRP